MDWYEIKDGELIITELSTSRLSSLIQHMVGNALNSLEYDLLLKIRYTYEWISSRWESFIETKKKDETYTIEKLYTSGKFCSEEISFFEQVYKDKILVFKREIEQLGVDMNDEYMSSKGNELRKKWTNIDKWK